MLPPVAAVNHTTVDPAGADAVAVSVWIGLCSQAVWLLPVGAAGAALIVSVTAVLVRLAQVVVLFTDCA